MSRRELAAGIVLFLAVAGAFGTIQFKGIGVTLPWQVALAGTLLIAIFLVLLSSVHGSSKTPSLHKNLVANVGYGRQRITVLRKSLDVEVRGPLALRRDGDFRWTLLVQNQSKSPVPELQVSLIGEVALREAQLAVSVALDGSPPVRARYSLEDANSPTVYVPFQMPGLASSESATVHIAYSWPGIVSWPRDRWVIDLSNVACGGFVEVVIRFPSGEAQQGRVELVNERLGIRWVRQLGAPEWADDDQHLMLRLRHVRGRRAERHLYLYTYDADPP